MLTFSCHAREAWMRAYMHAGGENAVRYPSSSRKIKFLIGPALLICDADVVDAIECDLMQDTQIQRA